MQFNFSAVSIMMIFATTTTSAVADGFTTQPTEQEAREWVKQYAPAKMPRKGVVPKDFMLMITDPGCNPGDDCDDVGTWTAIRRAYQEQSGANTGHMDVDWGATEVEAPKDGKHTFDFSKVSLSSWDAKQAHVICGIGHGNKWADKLMYSTDPNDQKLYEQRLAEWTEAAVRYVNKKYGVTLFSCGGNERDLVAESTYKPYFPTWYHYYMTPVRAIYAGLKKANPRNKLIAGNFCYTDRAHVACMFLPDGKRHFDLLGIHAYGPHGAHIDMEQLVEARQELDYRGAKDVKLIIFEGWSSLPLPASIEGDKTWKGGSRPYTAAEIEHYRQSILDGWRNLTTARADEYDPKWLLGANYFVLDDHWGGRGWAARGKAQYDDGGKLKGFLLDGYYIGTTDPDYLKPLLRPWGLIDIAGKPKGDTIYAFPPYIPKHAFTAKLDQKLDEVPYDAAQEHWKAPVVFAAKPYRVTVEFRNNDKKPFTNCNWSLSERSEKDSPGGYAFAMVQGQLHTNAQASAEHFVKSKLVEGKLPETIQPGETIKLIYEITFDPSLDTKSSPNVQKRIRPLADMYYLYEGRPYHTDAWLPRVMVKQ